MSFGRIGKRLIARLRASVRFRTRLRLLRTSARFRTKLGLKYGYRNALNLSRKVWDPSRAPVLLLRRKWWEMARTYLPAVKALPLASSMEFKSILSRIAEGETINQSELLPFLTAGRRAERVTINAMLADAYSFVPTAERLVQARVFADRAWSLSDFNSELLQFYLRVLSVTGDTPAIRSAYKRAGIAAARQGRISEALTLFDRWLWADHFFENVDRYEYDFDIMNCVDDFAASHRYTHQPLPALSAGNKIRIAWLAQGITEINSILIKFDLELAKYRDRERFEVQVFVPEQRAIVRASAQAVNFVSQFESLGCPVQTAPDSNDKVESLFGLAGEIHKFRPHIMVATAALANFSQYFITSLKPAPIQIGLVQGPPPQFAPPTLDWCIAWTRHPLMDCPIDCSWVPIFLDWPKREEVDGLSRAALGVPEEACVLLSAGRHPKFQDAAFWKAIVEVLTKHQDAYFLAVGITNEQVPFFDEVVNEDVRNRVRCLGWRKDFLNILATADVVADTYPNGGGQVITQAMAMGIPVVAHRNNYLRPFDQNDWSPVEDFLSEPDLLVERGDFSCFVETLNKLVEDPEYRHDAGSRCQAQHMRQADPAITVRRCEQIYTELYEQHSTPRHPNAL